MRKVFILVFLANIIFIIASLFILPEKVAMHFSGGGQPSPSTFRQSSVQAQLRINIKETTGTCYTVKVSLCLAFYTVRQKRIKLYNHC